MKVKVRYLLLLFSSSVLGDQFIYPTLPGTTIRDYTEPGVLIQNDGRVQPTLPGTNIPDYTESGYLMRGKNLRRTLPGNLGIIDYSSPGYGFDDNDSNE